MAPELEREIAHLMQQDDEINLIRSHHRYELSIHGKTDTIIETPYS